MQLILAGLCGLAALLPAQARAAETELQGYVLGVSGDSVSVDLGASQGLKAGDVGVLKRAGRRLGTLEVIRVDLTNAFLRQLDSGEGYTPKQGDAIFFTLAPDAAALKAGAGLGAEDGFVPLLAPAPTAKHKAASRVSTHAHGSLRAWQYFQAVDPVGARYRITRLDSDGTVDRIVATPWSFVWSGNLSYRDGNRPSTSYDFRRAKATPHRLTLTRPLGEAGFIRLGRFFPAELPALGTVDGAGVQLPVAGLKVGAVVGVRPDRRNQDFSSREQLASLYASVLSGSPGQGSYASTLGVMTTRWRGKADELAVLFDQRFNLGPLLWVYGSAQFDVDAGTAQVHKGVRATRLDLSANSTPISWLSLRAGLNHYEPLDIAAEREFTGMDPAVYIDNGYWRYWVGGAQTLPWGLGLDEEITFMNTGSKFESSLWRMTLSRQGLPWLPAGRSYATLYNIREFNDSDTDYGGSLGINLPFFDGRFHVDANVGLRDDQEERAAKKDKLSDATVRADWRISSRWQMDASVTRIWQGPVRSSSASGGVSCRW